MTTEPTEPCGYPPSPPRLGDVLVEGGRARWRCIAQWDGGTGWVEGSMTAPAMGFLATRYAFDHATTGGHYLCSDNPFDPERVGGAMVRVEPNRAEQVRNALDFGWIETSWCEVSDETDEFNRRRHDEEYERNLFAALVGNEAFEALDSSDAFEHQDIWMWLADAIDRLVTVAPLVSEEAA